MSPLLFIACRPAESAHSNEPLSTCYLLLGSSNRYEYSTDWIVNQGKHSATPLSFSRMSPINVQRIIG